MFTTIAILAISFATTTAPATQVSGEITAERLVGSWFYDKDEHSQFLMLKKDGTYSLKTSGVTAKAITGKWSLNERGELVRSYVGRSGKGNLETKMKVLRLTDDELELQWKPDLAITFKRTK
ncbi:MAG TPA: hypothetical protein VL282_07485 [Tepidisphaeraceae bacterium]|jgi:hypothetical protein|nr:hypothetical protein [Tepidisphaeraceae bacterium]